MKTKLTVAALVAVSLADSVTSVFAQRAQKPNTLIIWGDDIGLANVSAVFNSVATFKEFPPRSFPPSFNPANVMESTLKGIKAERKLREIFPLPSAGETAKPKE
jgi:hypothetical protein